jgi:hypothetical protein
MEGDCNANESDPAAPPPWNGSAPPGAEPPLLSFGFDPFIRQPNHACVDWPSADRDHDYLDDGAEYAIAHALRPWIVNAWPQDDGESTDWGGEIDFGEPTVLFRVFPVAPPGTTAIGPVDRELVVRYVFLWDADAGYTYGGCDGSDSHFGDNQAFDVRLRLVPRPDVVLWKIVAVDGGSWPGPGWPAGPAWFWLPAGTDDGASEAHPVLFNSKGKHHWYRDASCDYCDSPYSCTDGSCEPCNELLWRPPPGTSVSPRPTTGRRMRPDRSAAESKRPFTGSRSATALHG